MYIFYRMMYHLCSGLPGWIVSCAVCKTTLAKAAQNDESGCHGAWLIFHPYPTGILIPSKWGSSEKEHNRTLRKGKTQSFKTEQNLLKEKNEDNKRAKNSSALSRVEVLILSLRRWKKWEAIYCYADL